MKPLTLTASLSVLRASLVDFRFPDVSNRQLTFHLTFQKCISLNVYAGPDGLTAIQGVCLLLLLILILPLLFRRPRRTVAQVETQHIASARKKLHRLASTCANLRDLHQLAPQKICADSRPLAFIRG